jgi:hypothetical protein
VHGARTREGRRREIKQNVQVIPDLAVLSVKCICAKRLAAGRSFIEAFLNWRLISEYGISIQFTYETDKT